MPDDTSRTDVRTGTMHIGELAERTALSLRTIRHYDDVGLLPASARTEGGFRVYSEADYERLMLIRQMKPLGFSLEDMAELLALFASESGPEHGGTGQLTPRLQHFLDQALAQREKMARNLGQADDFISMLRRLTVPK